MPAKTAKKPAKKCPRCAEKGQQTVLESSQGLLRCPKCRHMENPL